MKELTKVFKGVSIPVEIIDEKNIYFDITGISKKYGKNITDWQKAKRTLELVEALEKSNGSDLIKVQKIKGKNTAIKIHNTLLINFARFISVDFEIASNEIIYDILTGDKVLIENEKKVLLDRLDQKEVQLIKAQKEIIEAKRKSYAYTRNGKFQCVTNIIRECNANISSNTLNKILLDKKVIGEKEYTCKKYVANGSESIEEDGLILVHKDTVIKVMRDYDVDFIEDNQMMMDFD